jgi:hypothetical protein
LLASPPLGRLYAGLDYTIVAAVSFAENISELNLGVSKVADYLIGAEAGEKFGVIFRFVHRPEGGTFRSSIRKLCSTGIIHRGFARKNHK